MRNIFLILVGYLCFLSSRYFFNVNLNVMWRLRKILADKVTAADRVLEIGCCNGEATRCLLRTGARVLATDASAVLYFEYPETDGGAIVTQYTAEVQAKNSKIPGGAPEDSRTAQRERALSTACFWRWTSLDLTDS